MIKKDTLQFIANHSSTFPEEITFISQIKSFVESNEDYYSRNNLKGHITGSSWILSPDKQEVLLIHHKKLNRWFQPGGHTEEQDKSIAETAYREGKEETGIQNLKFIQTGIFDIDIHTIPAKKTIPEHLHYDIRFIFQAKSKAIILNEEETSGIKWLGIQELLDSPLFEQSLKRMALKTINHI